MHANKYNEVGGNQHPKIPVSLGLSGWATQSQDKGLAVFTAHFIAALILKNYLHMLLWHSWLEGYWWNAFYYFNNIFILKIIITTFCPQFFSSIFPLPYILSYSLLNPWPLLALIIAIHIYVYKYISKYSFLDLYNVTCVCLQGKLFVLIVE